MKRGLVVVTVLVLSASCSSGSTATRVPSSSTTGIDRPDATAVLKAAAKLSLESDVVYLRESMTVKSAVVAVMSGFADFRNRTVRLIVGPGDKSSNYPPYVTSFVAGWNYVEIDAAVPRPRGLAAHARWVAFKNCYPHLVPVPGSTTPPGLVLQQLDDLTKPLVGAHFTGPPSNKRTRVQFGVARLGCPPTVNHVRWVVSIDTHGRIGEIKVGAPSLSLIVFTLEYVHYRIPRIGAPPPDQVQTLAPTDNLYSVPPSPA